MIENNLVKKIIKSIKKGKKSPLSDRNIMHPEREWFFSVLLGLFLLVVGGYWSFSVYLQFGAVDLEAVTVESAGEVYRANLVEAALFEINRRAETYDNLKINNGYAAPLPQVIEEESPALPQSEGSTADITFE